MPRPNSIQIKLIRDEPPRPAIDSPQAPGEKPEAIASELIQTTMGCVVVGYTVCKSVNFFFRMAEHYLVAA